MPSTFLEELQEQNKLEHERITAVIETFPFILSCFSVAFMIVLSAIGATVGSVKIASSAAMVANRSRDILTKAYLPILLSSAVFIYNIVLAIMMISKISMDISLSSATILFSAAVIYGFSAFFVGISLGVANKKNIVVLSRDKRVFLSFLILNSTMELPAVFSLICSIILISQIS